MRQFKNYLSNIYNLKTVLVATKSGVFKELVEYLVFNKGVEKVYWYSEDKNYSENSQVYFCSLEEIKDGNIQVDAFIFEDDCKEVIASLKECSIKYCIGRLNERKEYFSIWERLRNVTDRIYMEVPDLDSDVDAINYEILCWEKNATDTELSVIIPIYNVEKYVGQCIESLISWDAPYVEFLLVNDGSTDKSKEIITQYEHRDSRIKVIDKVNGGCASARNKGLEHARGTYIGFVDGDDFVEPEMFAKLLARAILGNYELCYCGYKEYYENNHETKPVLNDCLGEPYLSGTYKEEQIQLLAVQTRVAIWRCIYKRQSLERKKIRFYEKIRRFDDLPFRIECIFNAKSAVCVPEYLYYYRLGRQGQDVSCTDERLNVHFEIFNRLDKYVEPFSEQRILDLLQIVKLHTHGFALSIIDKDKKYAYMKKVRPQMDKYMGYWRTVCLMLRYTGKGNIFWYTISKLHMEWIYKIGR